MKAEHYETLEEAVAGITFPDEIRAALELVGVEYVSFEGDIRTGQLVVHKECAEDVRSIFIELKNAGFPIAKIVPITAYGWDDIASMEDNNTSAFNYRKILGTEKLSNHSYGRAIDINPLFNPYFAVDGNVYPSGATYEPERAGTITENSLVVKLFEERGWTWGGRWTDRKDYQHFEKP